MKASRPRALVIPAVLMILFGVAEVYTSFRHNFFGLTTVESKASAGSTALLGILYAAAGVVLLMLKWRGTAVAVALLGLVVVGRIGVVAAGLYPVNSMKQRVGIVGGTAIAVIFGVYVWWQGLRAPPEQSAGPVDSRASNAVAAP